MTIRNRTRWNTRHLAAIAHRVARQVLDPFQAKYVTITFVPGNTNTNNNMPRILGDNPRGSGLKTNHVVVEIVAVPEAATVVIALKVAVGLNMCLGKQYGIADVPLDTTGLANMPLALRKPTPRRKRRRRLTAPERLARAQRMAAKWQTRLKLARTKVAHWHRVLAQLKRHGENGLTA